MFSRPLTMSSKCSTNQKVDSSGTGGVAVAAEEDEKKHTNGLTASQVSECRKGEEGGGENAVHTTSAW